VVQSPVPPKKKEKKRKKTFVPKLKNEQFYMHFRKNTGFVQLKIQTSLPGSQSPVGSTPFLISGYRPLSNLELKACYSHDRPHFSLCPSEKCFPSA
jgi:hypothetical protein